VGGFGPDDDQSGVQGVHEALSGDAFQGNVVAESGCEEGGFSSFSVGFQGTRTCAGCGWAGTDEIDYRIRVVHVHYDNDLSSSPFLPRSKI